MATIFRGKARVPVKNDLHVFTTVPPGRKIACTRVALSEASLLHATDERLLRCPTAQIVLATCTWCEC